MSGKLIAFGVILALFILMVGTCEPEDARSSSGISSRQAEIINTQITTLHEEIAACRSPDGLSLLALVISISVPLVLAAILLFRAEKTSLHNDEIIRHVARTGLMPEFIDAEKLLDGKAQQALPSPHLLAVHGQRRESADPPKTPETCDPDDSGDYPKEVI